MTFVTVDDILSCGLHVHRIQAVEGLEEKTAVAHALVVKIDVDGHAGACLLRGGVGLLLAQLRRL